MSTETNTDQVGGGEALPAAQAPTEAAAPQRAPRNDAEAAAMEQAQQGGSPEAQAAAEDAKRKSRTTVYIDRLKEELAEARRTLRAVQSGGQQLPTQRQAPGTQHAASEPEPTLEDCNFDQNELIRRQAKWAAQEALKEHATAQQESQTREQQEKVVTEFLDRRAEFAAEHPDFFEVVMTIPYDLPPEVQLAIMAHEKGPQISYHIGNNDDDAFALASTQPHLATAAVARIAARMSAAPAAASAATPNALAMQAPSPAATKPISNAPAPAPTLGGRTPTEIPPEKLTDDAWFKREQERARKR